MIIAMECFLMGTFAILSTEHPAFLVGLLVFSYFANRSMRKYEDEDGDVPIQLFGAMGCAMLVGVIAVIAPLIGNTRAIFIAIGVSIVYSICKHDVDRVVREYKE